MILRYAFVAAVLAAAACAARVPAAPPMGSCGTDEVVSSGLQIVL